MDKHPRIAVEALVAHAAESGATIAVITGGEPLMHDLGLLTTELKKKNIRTHIETSGAHEVSGTWDWITFSPKKFKAPLNDTIVCANELKVVIYNKSDFEWAEKFATQVSNNCLLYMQPEWSRSAEMNPLIVEYIKSHPQWALSLQTHKYLDIP